MDIVNGCMIMQPEWHNAIATSPVVLRWLCDSPRTGCAWRQPHTYMWREQAITEWSWRVISGDINDVNDWT